MTSNGHLITPHPSPYCPVTGLPITQKPEWTDIPLDSDYSVTFCIIGNAILLIAPRGNPSYKGVMALLDKREAVIQEADLSHKDYVELRDYSMLTGLPPIKGRTVWANQMLREISKGHFLGFWVFGASLFMRLLFQTGQKMFKSPIPVGVAQDYPDAIRNALKVLRQKGVDVGGNIRHGVAKDRWALELEGYGISFELIGDDLLYTIAHGSLKEPDVEKFFQLHDKVLKETGLFQKGYFYRIINWERYERSSWQVRRMYIKGMKELNKRISCKLSVIFGLNPFMRALAEASRPFMPAPVMIAKDFQDALAIIENERERTIKAGAAGLFRKKHKEKTYTEAQVKGFADEMLRVLGELSWEQAGLSVNDISEEHPLKPAFDALAVIKLDLDELLQEKEKAQKTLRESEEKYRNILESIEDGYFEVDLAGKLTFFNPSMCAILGYTGEEMLGMKYKKYMDESSIKRVFDAFIKIYETGAPSKGFEWYIIRKDGAKKYLDVSASLITGPEGRPIGFRGIARDISERKSIELELEKHRNHLEEMIRDRTTELTRTTNFLANIINSSMDVIITTDIKGTILHASPRTKDILGYEQHELMGKKAHTLFAGGHVETEMILNELTKKGGIRGYEFQSKRTSGESIVLNLSISLLRDEKGDVIGTTGIYRDVTEEKRLEEDMKQAMVRAELASKAKGQFLANMSHEIRTPLNGILGMTDLCLETELDGEQRHLVNAISREAYSLLGIVNEVLDFSKIEAGKVEVERIPFDLSSLLEDVAESSSYRTLQKGLKFTFYLAPGTPTRLVGDPGRLRQVLRNLIDNAIKFTHEGGIDLKADLAEDTGDRIKVRFLVKDTGIGIPKEKQTVIFESFTQADGSTTRKYGGTGLGVTISKQLAELMGGTLGVDSEEGKGSTFWFTAVFSRQSETDSPRRKEVSLGHAKVLVVDGNAASRVTLVELLKSWGLDPVEAEGAKEALSILGESTADGERFNLVLSERNMPEMNGFDLARALRGLESTRSVPIILLTASGNPGDGKICRDIGIEGYLTKPLKESDLRRAIEIIIKTSISGERTTSVDLVTKHSSAEMDRKDIRILLAEDYPTNQEIARRHLEHAGYQVDLVEDGNQASEAFKRRSYDLILMDIQMPVMDGLQATVAIRKAESELASLGNENANQAIRRVPIIAMTAHAMQEHKERCLKAGMDDFLSKPLSKKGLLSMLDKWLQSRSRPSRPIESNGHPLSETGQDKGPIATRTDKPMDLERALEEFEGDRDVLSDVIEGFTRKVGEQIGTIRKALSCGDAETIRKEAHAIKGGGANLTAVNLSRVALELESKGKSRELEGAGQIIDGLERELAALTRYVQENFPQHCEP